MNILHNSGDITYLQYLYNLYNFHFEVKL